MKVLVTVTFTVAMTASAICLIQATILLFYYVARQTPQLTLGSLLASSVYTLAPLFATLDVMHYKALTVYPGINVCKL